MAHGGARKANKVKRRAKRRNRYGEKTRQRDPEFGILPVLLRQMKKHDKDNE